jgi:cytochrome oxidase Cu insertion factor (SCO1/SenC/PrrC family)
MSNISTNLIASRLKLLLVVLLFLGPLFAAFVWYYGFDASLAPEGQSNHAPLISPIVQIQEFGNQSSEAKSIDVTTLKKKWTIAHIVDSGCDDSCKQSLYNTRQTRIAVGKDVHRIQRLLIIDGTEELFEQVGLNHTDAIMVHPDQSGIEKQLERIIEAAGAGANDAVLIDPLGNAMMIIPLDLDPRLLLKDMKKLLKLSHIG